MERSFAPSLNIELPIVEDRTAYYPVNPACNDLWPMICRPEREQLRRVIEGTFRLTRSLLGEMLQLEISGLLRKRISFANLSVNKTRFLITFHLGGCVVNVKALNTIGQYNAVTESGSLTDGSSFEGGVKYIQVPALNGGASSMIPGGYFIICSRQ